MRAASLQPHLSAINKRHDEHGLAIPAKGPLVQAARRGFARLQQGQSMAPPLAPAPLPAPFASQVVDLGLRTKSTRARRHCALLVFAFLSFARPLTTGQTQLQDVAFDSDKNIHVQLRMLKSEVGRHRLTFQMPAGRNTRFTTLISQKQQDPTTAGAPEDWPLFRSPKSRPVPLTSADVSSTMHTFLKLFNCKPPLGSEFSAKATRSGAVLAAYAIGVNVETMRWMWGSRSLRALRTHYLDPRTKWSPAAEEFFGHLRLSTQAPSPQLEQ